MVEQPSDKFGFIRLLLATMVLAAHASELSDGNRSRELLTQFGRSLSLGELAVNGFFLVSGYLIAQSVLRSSTPAAYLRKRFLRIVPAYVVAYLAMFLLAAFVGGDLGGVAVGRALVRMLLLLPPEVPGAFAGLAYPFLNGSMWTIAFEFRCYLLVLLLGMCGLLTRPVQFGAGLAIAVAVLVAPPNYALPWPLGAVLGDVKANARLIPIFLIGTGFYVLRDWLPTYTAKRALFAAGCAVASLFSWRLANLGVAVFGGYALLWFALASRPTWLNGVGGRRDISYGVYLYGWPVQNLLIWIFPGTSPMLVFCGTLPLVAVLGWLSWTLIEGPALRFKEARRVRILATPR